MCGRFVTVMNIVILRYLLSVAVAVLPIFPAFAEAPARAAEQGEIPVNELVAPVEGPLKYPFTKKESISCGRWMRNSQDLPYFGAPRDNGRRNHAGVDIYPRGGAGFPVRAVADGVVIKIAPFYTRANGEVTYGVLVDHAGFVANYAELVKPDFKVATVIRQGETIGRISGTRQLHFEIYGKGTKDWLRWVVERPDNLLDPTGLLMKMFAGKVK